MYNLLYYYNSGLDSHYPFKICARNPGLKHISVTSIYIFFKCTAYQNCFVVSLSLSSLAGVVK